MYRKRWDSLRGNNMNSMEKFISWLEEREIPFNASAVDISSAVYKKAKSLLAEDSQEPQAPMGLKERVEALTKELSDTKRGLDPVLWQWHIAPLLEILIDKLSHHPAPETESLAELADRKGVRLRQSKNEKGIWFISLRKPKSVFGYRTVTTGQPYSEAESKAREYLNGLPDKPIKE